MTNQTLQALFITIAAHSGLGYAIYELAPRALIPNERCDNNIDDDENGFTDCDDAACTKQPKSDVSCRIEVCTNSIDDDEDGLTDCQDPDCNTSPMHASCLIELPPPPIEVKFEPPPPEPEPEPEASPAKPATKPAAKPPAKKPQK